MAGIAAAAGVLTIRGARTSHAAVVARQLGKVCLIGCDALIIDSAIGRITLGDHVVREREWLTFDGDTGQIFMGRLDIETERPEALMKEVERWRERIQAKGHAT